MTVLTKQNIARGWPVLAVAGAGCIFVAFMLYGALRLTIYGFIEAEPDTRTIIIAIAMTIATAYALFLEVRTFVQLLKGTSASFLNLVRAIEIHLRVFLGVATLILGPAITLMNFPRTYESITGESGRQDSIDPELVKITVVAFAFLAAAMFIQWCWSFLKGVQETTDRMTATRAMDEDEGQSESASL